MLYGAPHDHETYSLGSSGHGRIVVPAKERISHAEFLLRRNIRGIRIYGKTPDGSEVGMLRILTLLDDKAGERKCVENRHGLCYLVQYDGHTVIFDTGPDDTALKNAFALGEDIRKAEATVISHSHYDHATGFKYFIESGLAAKKLFIGPDFFQEKYSCDLAKHANLSAGYNENYLISHGIFPTTVTDEVEVFPGFRLYCAFERRNSCETIPGKYVRRTPSGFVKDDFHDEIAAAIETSKGLVVLVGCSHPGILNIAESITERSKKHIHAIFGGTHLKNSEEARIRETIGGLEDMGVSILGLSHCSGDAVDSMLRCRTKISSCHLAVADEFFFD